MCKSVDDCMILREWHMTSQAGEAGDAGDAGGYFHISQLNYPSWSSAAILHQHELNTLKYLRTDISVASLWNIW